jgi:general secretion pathway protein F
MSSLSTTLARTRGTEAGASYLFIAARTGGGRKMGVRAAAGERSLAEALRRERLLLLRSYRIPGTAGAGRGLRLRDRAEMNEQLAQLLSRGVPLVEALEVVASTVAPSAKGLVERMRELVSAGSSFADACQRVKAFDRVDIAVYRAAERTGDLAGAARQLARTARRQVAVVNKARTLMVYPVIVVSISSIVVGLLLMVVVPIIGRSMSSMGVPLSWYSKLVFGAGIWLRDNAAIALGAMLALLIVLAMVWRRVLRAIGAGVRRLPVARDLVLAQESARFFSVMAAMTRSGVPLADALGVANEVMGLPRLKRQLVTLRTRLIEGGVLRNLIENVTELPLATRRLLIAAERAGDLETAFEGLAADLADQVDQKSERFLSALEPLLIVAMFLAIGSILLAIMLPLLTMATKVI